VKRSAPLRRTPLKSKRSKPRRRPADRWTRDEWEDANLILAARSAGMCERCGKEPWTQRHHRKRRRDGGESFPNITALCAICHAWCHEHPALSRQYGWIVSVYMDPVTVPFLRHRREWVLFDEYGGIVPAFAPE
jgi:hypothetical protein